MILYADDVVLAEIAAGLDLDQFKKNLAEIFEAVDGAHRNINRLVLVHSLDDVNRLRGMEPDVADQKHP